MHVLVPFASADPEAARHVIRDLALPNLAALVAAFEVEVRDDGDARDFSPPHERALAAWRGWQAGDGAFPVAAHLAAGDGIDTGHGAWGLVSPCHWLLGRDHAVMTDPDALALDEPASRALYDAARPLFADDGFATAFGSPTRWYVARDDLDGFPTASLDRAIGRDVGHWIGHDDPRHVAVRRQVRRLQSEVQILFHAHDVNDDREARGLAAVNSFWLSGCGRAQPVRDDAAAPEVDARLRSPVLAADWDRVRRCLARARRRPGAPSRGRGRRGPRRRRGDAHALRRTRLGAPRLAPSLDVATHPAPRIGERRARPARRPVTRLPFAFESVAP